MSSDSLYFHTPEPTPAPAAPKPEPKTKPAPAKPADKWKPYKLGQ